MPARFEVGIVPGPCDEPNRRIALIVICAPAGVERLDDSVHVTHRSPRGIRIASIGNDLHVGRRARHQPPREILLDLDHQ